MLDTSTDEQKKERIEMRRKYIVDGYEDTLDELIETALLHPELVKQYLAGFGRETLVLMAVGCDVFIGVDPQDTKDFEDTETLRKYLFQWICD
jgi:hypothetical protein